jgi:TfoX/Sxy family transcriptional regulator of competence genes
VAGDPHRFDDLFSEFGPVRLRRFFGGEGIRAGDILIGMADATADFMIHDPAHAKKHRKSGFDVLCRMTA